MPKKTATTDEAACSLRTPPKVSPDQMRAVARKLAGQPIQDTEAGVWAVLTAVSKNARLRPQGINILLSADEHCLGRTVEEPFRISGLSISGKHCKIYRDTVLGELNHDEPVPVYLKDTSSNGTYLNWKKVKKNLPPAKLNHGDIISFTTPPHDDTSYTFVYREVALSYVENGATILKRKSGEVGFESKRIKDHGPGSLDDVRRLETSNSDLREHVVTIENLRERKMAQIQHEELMGKQNELKSRASKQSRDEADQIISSLKTTIGELEAQLNKERNLRREERDKADKATREHKEVISKLQESENKTRLLVETLRSKLEDAQQRSGKKVKELQAELQWYYTNSKIGRKQQGQSQFGVQNFM